MVNYFDIIIIIPLLWGAFKGFKKGLVVEIASIVALFLGIWGGVKFSSVSASFLGDMFSISEKLMPLISFAVTFILIVILIFTLAKLLQKVIKMVSLSTINKIAGALFGALKFALIISVILNLVNNVNREIPFIEPEMEDSSLLYKPVSKLALILVPGLGEINIASSVEDAIKEEAIEEIENTSVVN